MILIINTGSSNVKFALYNADLTLAYKAKVNDLEHVFKWLELNNSKYKVSIVGHRIVHGGLKFFEPTLLTPEIIAQLKDYIPLAPLHQPFNIAAVEDIRKEYPNLKQVGCFDTAFHRTQTKLSKLFAIPTKLTEQGVIRYGFHGLSYEYIASVLQTKIGIVANKKVIIAHLGNGASMCAMDNLKSVSTSMGFSALDGLMMGSRCGNIDPGVLLYLMQEQNYTVNAVADLLYRECGLLGVSEISNDVQTLLASDATRANLALELFCYRAAEMFGQLMVSLQGCDALIFTAGIGENAAWVRAKICEWLTWLGVKINIDLNAKNNVIISTHDSKILVAVVPTNEEYIIAQHTAKFISVM